MQKHYTLIGRSNVIIGSILENLYSHYQNDVDVEIVRNLEEMNHEIPFLHKHIEIKENYYKNWIKKSGTEFILAVNKVDIKRKVVHFFKEYCNIHVDDYTNCIHKSSVIYNGVIFDGAVNIQALSVVAQYTRLGKFVSINRNVSIGHHTFIDEFTTINPGVNIGGHVEVGKNVTIGIGSNIFDNIKIGNNSIIGGGSTVTKDVPENALVYGSPAKVIKMLN